MSTGFSWLLCSLCGCVTLHNRQICTYCKTVYIMPEPPAYVGQLGLRGITKREAENKKARDRKGRRRDPHAAYKKFVI